MCIHFWHPLYTYIYSRTIKTAGYGISLPLIPKKYEKGYLSLNMYLYKNVMAVSQTKACSAYRKNRAVCSIHKNSCADWIKIHLT
jgi:hypothetical protein